MSKSHFTLKLKKKTFRQQMLKPISFGKNMYSVKKVAWTKKPYFTVGKKQPLQKIEIIDLETINKLF